MYTRRVPDARTIASSKRVPRTARSDSPRVCVCLSLFLSFLCCFLCLYFFAFRIDLVIFWGIHAKFSGNLAVSPESTSFPRKVRRFPRKTRHFSTFAKSAPRHQPPRKRSNYVQSASVAVCRTRNVERLDAPGFWRHFADLSHAAASAPCVRIRGIRASEKAHSRRLCRTYRQHTRHRRYVVQ